MNETDIAYILFFIGMMMVGFVLSLPDIVEQRKLKKSKLKCKLLRKVHRDYKIYWCPDGVGNKLNACYLITYQGQNLISFEAKFYFEEPETKIEALNQAKNYILYQVRKEYKPKPTYKRRKPIKVWHN